MFHPFTLFGALGVVEPIQRPNKIPGYAACAFKTHATAYKFFVFLIRGRMRL
jgi:hypothetical protein